MTIWAEAREGIGGALQIARRDLSGLGRFNYTVDGFWRSFFAAVLLVPLEVLQISFFGSESELAVGELQRWIIHGTAYLLAWTAWPLASFYLARMAGVGDRWLDYVIVYNWAQVPVAVVFTLVLFLGTAIGNGGGLVFLGVIAVMVYEWYIAWKVLRCTGPVAAGFEILNFALLFIINAFAMAALGVQPAGSGG